MRIQITVKDYINGKFFNVGEVYDASGTETITEGCGCNGTKKQYNTFIIMLDNVKYNIKTDKAEQL